MKREILSESDLQAFGERIGRSLKGGEVFELIGDVGAGKTTLTKAIARGMGIDGPIQSPTFTISNKYETADGKTLAHYDFYRLDGPGIMKAELEESVNSPDTVVVIEWGGIVTGVLPKDHLRIEIVPIDSDTRRLEVTAGGTVSNQLMERLA